jgi:5-methylcytosine-specific restriction protein A
MLTVKQEPTMPSVPSSGDFRRELAAQFSRAENRSAAHVEINSGELHRSVGGYPGPNHRMPICCEVMYGERTDDDEIVSQPPEGKGASLTIRYKLPRNPA